MATSTLSKFHTLYMYMYNVYGPSADPGMNYGKVRYARESQDTWTGEGYAHTYSPSADPGMNLGRVGDTRESQDSRTRDIHIRTCTLYM